MPETSKSNAWAEVDAWKSKQWNLVHARRIEMLKLGWVLIPSDDGTYWARPLSNEDGEDGELAEHLPPQAKGDTFETLLATVKARVGKAVGHA